MSKYRTFGSLFDRVFRNDLNKNFDDIDKDIKAQKTRVDDLIRENPQPSEVVDARLGFPVLRDKLEATDEQLAQTVEHLNSREINVKFPPAPLISAKGDGITNDSVAIQAVNDLLNSMGGGTILIPKGTFLANIIVDSNINIVGDGISNTFLKSAPNSNKDVIKGRNFDTLTGTTVPVVSEGVRFFNLSNITIDGNKDNNTSGYGVRIWGCYFTWENILVQNCANDGIWTEFSRHVAPTPENFRNQLLESEFRNVKIAYCDGNGWSFNGPHDALLDNFIAIRCLGWAFYQRDFNSFLQGQNWNSWLNGNGYYIGTGLGGTNIVTDNDNKGTGIEFGATGGNSRIYGLRMIGFDTGIITRGQNVIISGTVSGCKNAMRIEGSNRSNFDIVATGNDNVFDVVNELGANTIKALCSIPSGKTIQTGANFLSASSVSIQVGGAGTGTVMQFPDRNIRCQGWNMTLPQANGNLLTDQVVPTSTTRGGVLRQNPLPDVSAPPTAGEFNTLLSRLRAAGVLSSS